jgi:hypothetical protein
MLLGMDEQPKVFTSFWPFWRAEMAETLRKLGVLLVMLVRYPWFALCWYLGFKGGHKPVQ